MLPRREEIAQVVVCEDDLEVLEPLCEKLRADLYGVHPAPTASDALRLCQYRKPDLLLLDLGLPDAAGMDLLREVRNRDRARTRFDPHMGVVVISGRGDEDSRVRALNEGADDFVQKPYAYQELLARMGSVLRRVRVLRDPPTHVGELVIDHADRTVMIGDRTVKLSSKEFALLCALAVDPTRVLTKEELLQDVWGYRSNSHTRTLEAHASRLRRKLDPEGGKFVVNCWGVGYRLVRP